MFFFCSHKVNQLADATGIRTGKRPPIEAALLPGCATLFTHERVVSVDLA
jgi:hypothetical protein